MTVTFCNVTEGTASHEPGILHVSQVQHQEVDLDRRALVYAQLN